MSTLWKTRRNFVCTLFVSGSSSDIKKGLAGISGIVILLHRSKGPPVFVFPSAPPW